MIITKATNVTIFFTEMEYKLLCQWLENRYHIKAPRAARFIIQNVEPLKHSFDFVATTNGHGYQLSENLGSKAHPWRISFPNTQMSALGSFNKIPIEVSIGNTDVLHMKMDREAIAVSVANPPVPVTRTRSVRSKEPEIPFEPKVIVDVPLADDPTQKIGLPDFIVMVQDINSYLKMNPAIVVQVKNNRIVYLISNE